MTQRKVTALDIFVGGIATLTVLLTVAVVLDSHKEAAEREQAHEERMSRIRNATTPTFLRPNRVTQRYRDLSHGGPQPGFEFLPPRACPTDPIDRERVFRIEQAFEAIDINNWGQQGFLGVELTENGLVDSVTFRNQTRLRRYTVTPVIGNGIWFDVRPEGTTDATSVTRYKLNRTGCIFSVENPIGTPIYTWNRYGDQIIVDPESARTHMEQFRSALADVEIQLLRSRAIR